MKTFEEYNFKDIIKNRFGNVDKSPDPVVSNGLVDFELPPITLQEIVDDRFDGLNGLHAHLIEFVQYLHGEFVDKKVKIGNDKPFIVYNIILTLEYDGDNNNVNILFHKSAGSYINLAFQSPIIKIVKRRFTEEDPLGEEDWND